MKKISNSMLVSAVFACMLLIGCSSGGGTASTGAQTISGVAAAGAPLSGTAFLKDSSNPTKELSQTIGVDGSFSFDVTNLMAPFFLKAVGTSGGQNFTLFSFTPGSGIANINPLSHLALSQALGGTDPSGLFDNPDSAKIRAIATVLPSIVADIQTKLEPILSLGGASAVHFISDPFAANHRGLDQVFDLVSASVSAGTVTITNKSSGAIIFTSALGNNTLSGQIDINNLPVLPSGSTYTISGNVTTAAGAGIPGVAITCSGAVAAASTDTDGSFSFPGVPNGIYTLSASLAGSAFSPASLLVIVNNADATGRNFISVVETGAELPGNKFFTFADGVVDGGVQSEIIYDDLEGNLILIHASALEASQSYADIMRAPYGVYRDSNVPNPFSPATPPAFPANSGAVYVMRSTVGTGVQYYKLRITSATRRSDPGSINYGTVNFSYAPILPQDIINAVGEWQSPVGWYHLSVLPTTMSLQYYESKISFQYSIRGDYANRTTIVGHFVRFSPSGGSGAVTANLELTAEGRLNVVLTGDAPLWSLKLMGLIKQ